MSLSISDPTAANPPHCDRSAACQCRKFRSRQARLSAFVTKSILNLCKLGQFLGLLVVCSCASTSDSPSTLRAGKLPADVTMNQNAGRGRLLIMPIRLESGEELPFLLDTGASGTCFDKSLEPRLGKRLDTGASWHFVPRRWLAHANVLPAMDQPGDSSDEQSSTRSHCQAARRVLS